MSETIGAVYEFGSFRLDPARRLLTQQDRHVTLPPKSFQLLMILVESHGRVFTKKELMSALWPDTFVEDANLSFQVSVLRKALGAEGGEWIETLPRYGYRFSGEVRERESAEQPDKPLLQPPEVPEAMAAARPRLDHARMYRVLCVLLGLGATYFAFAHLRETPPGERSVLFQVWPPEHVTTPDSNSIALSPNGEHLAFIGIGPDGAPRLWIRALRSLTSSPVPGTELIDSAFWSPDNQSIAFFAAGKLKRLNLQTGSIQVICDAPAALSAGTWSPNGTILFGTAEHPELYRVPASGGKPAVATHLVAANHETRHSAPHFLPDGRHFIYFVQSDVPENTGIYLSSLDSSRSVRLTGSTANGAYAHTTNGLDYLLYARGTNLMAQEFSLSKQELTGMPFVASERLLVLLASGLPRAAISSSNNGVLAYRTRIDTGSTKLEWVDRAGNRLETIGESADYSNPALSPDGRRLIVSRMDPQTHTRDLWLYDFGNGASSRVTFDPADETNAIWSPDGTRIAFNIFRNGVSEIYEMGIEGASEPKLLLHSHENKYLHTWSPDGKFLLFRIGPLTWELPLSGGLPIGPYPMENARISPNGKWAAYTSTESGRSEVYVQHFPPGPGKWQISAQGGTEPAWRSDGTELYFVWGEKLMAMQVKTDGEVFKPGAAKPLFEIHLESTTRRTRYQPDSAGRRFLINRPIEASAPITVALGWANPAR